MKDKIKSPKIKNNDVKCKIPKKQFIRTIKSEEQRKKDEMLYKNRFKKYSSQNLDNEKKPRNKKLFDIHKNEIKVNLKQVPVNNE